MNPILSAGLIIGVACALWTFFMGVTGWYKDPTLLVAFFAVIPIEIAGLVWGLRRTAAEGRGYTSQIVAGTMMAIVAGSIIICSSLLFTTVAFPDYFNELNAAQRAMMQQQGKSDAEITAAIDAAAPMQKPIVNALMGFIGTFITGVVASAVIAIWIREKGPRLSAARA
jgi:hypothetical protein